MNAVELTRTLLGAIERCDRRAIEAVLAPDAGARTWRPDGTVAARERTRVAGLLLEEREGWPWVRLEVTSAGGDPNRAAVQFVFQVRERGRVVDYPRSLFAEAKDGLLTSVELYAPGPIPAARRGWIATAGLPAAELAELWRSIDYLNTDRRFLPVNQSSYWSFDHRSWGTGDPHPGSNNVACVHWSAEEADRRIEDTIAWHRERAMGFQWRVGDFDEPADLGERLERHGFLLAGDQALMARIGMDGLDEIGTNPAVRIDPVDANDATSIEAALQITAAAFQWTREQVDLERPSLFEMLRTMPSGRLYLAKLHGQPVGEAMLDLRGPVAYLAGAATLPGFRGERVYSSLLKRRLEDARDAGREIAVIHAEPMSRRVVEKYGFQAVAWYRLYGWMPQMDPDVIRTLVQTD